MMGRSWRLGSGAGQPSEFAQLLRWLYDSPSAASPFSVHNLCSAPGVHGCAFELTVQTLSCFVDCSHLLLPASQLRMHLHVAHQADQFYADSCKLHAKAQAALAYTIQDASLLMPTGCRPASGWAPGCCAGRWRWLSPPHGHWASLRTCWPSLGAARRRCAC